MPEPLKNLYDEALIDALAAAVGEELPTFDGAAFKTRIFADPWPDLELKERMARVTECLGRFLPPDYGRALAVLKPVSSRFSGFEHMYFPGFVERFGLDAFEPSMDALAHVTRFSSSEFAVRPFILRYGERMMGQMARWARDENHHVRRLASEGCRPRLPWAMALPAFQADPEPVLEILELLRHDPSEYVRRSVANNLNDVSKDHGDRVLELVRRWADEGVDAKLIKHACRTLLKQGRSDAMTFFGFTAPEHLALRRLTVEPSVRLGESLSFAFELVSSGGPIGKVRLEYGVDFLKKNGRRSRKVFKISEVTVDGPRRLVERRHPIKPITTRTYYPGEHGLAVLVNGRELGTASFRLDMEPGAEPNGG